MYAIICRPYITTIMIMELYIVDDWAVCAYAFNCHVLVRLLAFVATKKGSCAMRIKHLW